MPTVLAAPRLSVLLLVTKGPPLLKQAPLSQVLALSEGVFSRGLSRQDLAAGMIAEGTHVWPPGSLCIIRMYTYVCGLCGNFLE